MTRTEEILNTIAASLSIRPGDLRTLLVFLMIAGLVLLFAVLVQRAIVRRREIRESEHRYQRQIRDLNLTILELDVIDHLARFLRDPRKRVLLLQNRNTFSHCSKAVGTLPGKLSAAQRHLAKRLGFAEGAATPGLLSGFSPAPGTGIKLEIPTVAGRLLARVLSAEIDQITVSLADEIAISEATEVTILASHPSGLLEARAVVMKVGQKRLVLQIVDRFQHVSHRDFSDRRLRIQIGLDGSQDRPEPAELLRAWRTGADIESSGRRFHRGDTIRIYVHRGKDARAAINAEVRRARTKGKNLRVRFSHLSAPVRESILGKAG